VTDNPSKVGNYVTADTLPVTAVSHPVVFNGSRAARQFAADWQRQQQVHGGEAVMRGFGGSKSKFAEAGSAAMMG
jgi:hypothetical protein